MPPCTHRHILAIEDDPLLGAHLQQSLGAHGFAVTLAGDGGGGLALAEKADYDLILLDVLLPGLDGLDVLARLRRRRRTPVIMISALGDEPDRIRGFDGGADDYLPKPFSLAELRVRIEAVLRRVAYERERQPARSPATVEAGLRFDEARNDVAAGGAWAGFTATEYRLFELLFSHAGEVLSKPFLYQQVLHRGYSQHDRSLDMHVSNLRRKLARLDYQGGRIEAVWGKGYLLVRQDA